MSTHSRQYLAVIVLSALVMGCGAPTSRKSAPTPLAIKQSAPHAFATIPGYQAVAVQGDAQAQYNLGMEYMDSGHGTVVMTADGMTRVKLNSKPFSNLVWQMTAAGPMTYDEAVTYCADLKLAGRTDWRLPTYWELKTIAVRDQHNSPTLSIHPLFANGLGSQNGEATVWAFSSAGWEDDAAWCFNYFTGGPDVEMKGRKNYVLAVADDVH